MVDREIGDRLHRTIGPADRDRDRRCCIGEPEVLPATIVLLSVALPEFALKMPPPPSTEALLPKSVALLIVIVSPLPLYTPPPSVSVELWLIVTFVRVVVPKLLTPPPSLFAVLPAIVEFQMFSVSWVLLITPPPYLPRLPAIVDAEMVAE